MTDTNRKLIIGCGYLGRRVARKWITAGFPVSAVTRSADRVSALRAEGIDAIQADVANRKTLSELPECSTLLYALGYDAKAGRTRKQVQIDGLRSVLDALRGRVGRIIFISTTGVYAQNTGEWIDESSSTEPDSESGRAALNAEEVLTTHPSAERSVILRLAGLYGPGRVPRRDLVRRGEPISSPPDAYLNLIHVDDASEIVERVDANLTARDRYCISDGHPVKRRDYYSEVARRYASPTPEFVVQENHAPKSGRGYSNKRISNRRMIAELGVKLSFPSYREGLAAITAPSDAE